LHSIISLENLFDLDLSRTDVLFLSVLPALLNLAICFYVLIFQPKSTLNILFSFFVFIISLWQISDAFMRLSVTIETAEDWLYILGQFVILATPVGIIFVAYFLQWDNKRWFSLLFISQVVPATIFLTLNIGRIDSHYIVQSDQWYWIPNPNKSTFTELMYFWITLQSMAIQAILWNCAYRNPKGSVKRKQSQLLAIGFLFPIVGGLFFQVVYPLLFNKTSIPVAPSFFTAFSFFSALAMVKYNLLEFSPKQHWDKIVETMNEGLIIVNLNNEIMYANTMFCDVTGYTNDELIHSRATGRFLDHTQDVLSVSFKEPYEFQITSKSGKKTWFLVSRTPYLDHWNKTTGHIIIYTNVNESKRSEALFRALAENVGDFISMTDKNSNFLYASPAMLKALDYSMSELKDRSIFEIMHPEQAKESMSNFNNILDKPGTLIPRVNRFVSKNGREIWVEGVVINLLHDENVQAIVSNHRDISERRAHEAKLQQFLNVTTDQNKRLQNFTHIVSHNIRSHVVNIAGIVDIMNASDEKTEQQKLMQMLKASTDKLSETTDNLNDIITIQNKLDNSRTRMNLREEIIKTGNSISAITINTNIINDVNESVFVNAVPAYLESILLNMLTNAIKYRSPERDLVVRLYVEETSNYKVLCIQDNGIGIDLTLHGRKLFGMYKTFHSNKDARGLGLFISKTQIEAMGGKIEIESTPNIGTTFKIYFITT
jgi:PAS domain S-box-containing protein